jgi:capsid protein
MLIDNTGRPIPPSTIAQIRDGARRGGGRMSGSLTGPTPSFFPYDGADWGSQELGGWNPWIQSPDAEINVYRDRMSARVRDLRRNDPWVSGAISRILDPTIGANYRFVSKPDYRALALYAPGFDAVWAAEYRQALEALLRNYAADIGRYADLGQEMTLSQMFRVALGHKLVDGESVLVAHWRPDRIGPGAATWATCFQGIDPDRLSNPNQGPDTRYMRGGVELDDDQVHVAYHIRKAHQYDWYNSIESMEWDRVERIDPDGWRRVYHDYDPDRFGQSRGVSVFAPVISKLKMLARLYGVKLQAETSRPRSGSMLNRPSTSTWYAVPSRAKTTTSGPLVGTRTCAPAFTPNATCRSMASASRR